MSRKRLILALMVAALATIPAAPAASLGPLGGEDHQTLFQDSVGDALPSADIATVVVSNDNAGFLSFQVLFSEKPAKDLTVRAYLDTDRNAGTGAARFHGADYEVVVWDLSEGGSSFSLRHWDGKTFNEFFSQAPDVELKGGVLTFAFASSDLGRTRAFKFTLATERRAGATLDRAPNAGRTPWSFRMKTAPVHLSIVRFKTTSRAFEGHKFVASMTAKPSTPIAGLATRLVGPVCVATVGAKSLSERSSSMNETAGSPNVSAVCVWKIPTGTGGKLFRGSVRVRFLGRTLTRRFSAGLVHSPRGVLGRAQLPAIAETDARLAQVSPLLREKFAFFSTAADAAASTVDPSDTAADMKRLGRIAGYVRGRNARGAFTGRPPKGLLDVLTSVSLWRDAAAARASISQEIADEKRFAGKKLPRGELVSVACSDVRSLRAILCHEHTRTPRGIDLYGTSVLFTVDRVRGVATVIRSDAVNVDDVALRLAARLRLRALAAVGRRH